MKLPFILLALFLMPGFATAMHNDPLNADAPVPATQYRFTFSDYQQFKAVKANQWKTVNEKAGKNGMAMQDMMNGDTKMDDMKEKDMKPHEMMDMKQHNMKDMK